MAEEVKTGMCGLCGMHCRISLRVRDGELVGVESPWGKGSAIGKLLAALLTAVPERMQPRSIFTIRHDSISP